MRLSEQQHTAQLTQLWDLLSSDTQVTVERARRHNLSAGWMIKPRTIRDHILYIIVGGAVEINVNGTPYLWKAGQCAWVGPGLWHTAKAHNHQPVHCFILRWHAAKKNGEILSAPQEPLQQNTPPDLLAAADELWRLRQSDGPLKDLRLRCRLGDMLSQFLDHYATKGDEEHGAHLSREQCQHIQAWLTTHLAHHPVAGDLAHICDLNPVTFRRRFQRSFGCSPREWITAERLRAAAATIRESDEAIHAIAESCGYHSMPSFTRLFTKQFGCSPRTWRLRNQ